MATVQDERGGAARAAVARDRGGRPAHDARPSLVEVGPSWARRYRRWARRLRPALGDAFDGGILLDLAHVGSTGVPGLLAKPTLDLMARVHPWPPPPAHEAALRGLGFVARGEHGLPGRAYYTYGSHQVHLHVVGNESDHWARHLALRDLLRAVPEARDRYAAAKRAALEAASRRADADLARRAYQDAKAGVVSALEREALTWRAARTGFVPLVRLARWLASAPARWAVAGGWALDLVAGAPARHHEDVDVAVDREDAVRLLDRLAAVGVEVAWVTEDCDGMAGYRRRTVGERPPSGVHQAHARRSGLWLDVLLEPWSGDTWCYRRAPEVVLPLAQAVRLVRIGAVEVPVLAPEAGLLFKATTFGRARPRAKDDADLERMLPLLDPPARAWLRGAIAATASGHPWLDRLA